MEESNGSCEYVKYVGANGALELFVLSFAEGDMEIRRHIVQRLHSALRHALKNSAFVMSLNDAGDIWVRLTPPQAKSVACDRAVTRITLMSDVLITTRTTSPLGASQQVLRRAGLS